MVFDWGEPLNQLAIEKETSHVPVPCEEESNYKRIAILVQG